MAQILPLDRVFLVILPVSLAFYRLGARMDDIP